MKSVIYKHKLCKINKKLKLNLLEVADCTSADLYNI